MSVSHIIVIVFMLITVAFIVWLEIDSRKNAKQEPPTTRETREHAPHDS